MTKLKKSKGTWTQKEEDEAWVQEIAALIASFYELFVRMGYLPKSAIAYPPHNIEDETLKKFDLSPLVVLLIKSLPYVEGESRWGHCNRPEWIHDGEMLDLRWVCLKLPHM